MTEQEDRTGGTILVVDDDGRVQVTLRNILKKEGHSIIEAYDGGRAAEIFLVRHDEIDAVIMDWKMPGLDGHNWISLMLAVDPDAQIIFCTGYDIPEDIRKELETQVVGFVDKPIDPKRILGFVARAVAHRKAA